MEQAVVWRKISRIPTRAGEELGVQLETWKRDKPPLWSVSAQRFILDNLNGIVEDLASGEAYLWEPRELVLIDEAHSRLYTQIKPEPVSGIYLERIINDQAFGCGEGRPNLVPVFLIKSWLYQEGYTEQGTGGEDAQPTQRGATAGVVKTEMGIGLTEAGQRFIYDNVDHIFDYYRELTIRKGPARSGEA